MPGGVPAVSYEWLRWLAELPPGLQKLRDAWHSDMPDQHCPALLDLPTVSGPAIHRRRPYTRLRRYAMNKWA